MNFKSIMAASLCAMALFASCGNADTNRTIVTDVPERPAGQTDMLGFAAEPMDSVRIGVVGLGMRGSSAASRLTFVPGARVTAICDIDTARVNKVMARYAAKNYGPVATYGGEEESWKQLCEDPNVDLVYVVTDWKRHTPIAKYAMEQGKHTAIEVPAASTLEEIWDLINTSEKTRKHCMMLENCVYDFFEMNTLNMAQQGLFGEVLHTEGSYIHNLDEFWPAYANNWRLEFNKERRGDVYPTHGVGPACQLLDIHRGDRMTTLVAMDTKAVNGPAAWKKMFGETPDTFANGDHTMTMIRTANGKTIQIQLPSAHGAISPEQQAALEAQYTHPIIREVGEVAKTVGGHGGMDYIMDYRLVYCLLNGLPLDMDVYDLAEWCALTPLSEISIANGSAPVEVPDFTRGGWDKVKGYRHAYKK